MEKAEVVAMESRDKVRAEESRARAGGGMGEPGGAPNGPEMLQDPLKFDPKDEPPPADVKVEDHKDVSPDGDVGIEKNREEQKKIDEALARGERRGGFGGSYGDGVGKGRNTSKRAVRQTRWTIVLPRESPEVFLKKLIQIKAILLIPEGDSVSNFKICENLEKRPVELKSIDQKGINSYNRLWYMSHEKTDCDYIARGLYLTNAPRWIAIFIPQDLEQELALQEFNYKKMSEDELNNRKWITIFEVDRRGDTWEVRVRYQGPRKK